MLFTNLARVAAFLVLGFGVLLIAIGFFAPHVEPINRDPGRAIDMGIYSVILGVVIGVLSDISKSLLLIAERISGPPEP